MKHLVMRQTGPWRESRTTEKNGGKEASRDRTRMRGMHTELPLLLLIASEAVPVSPPTPLVLPDTTRQAQPCTSDSPGPLSHIDEISRLAPSIPHHHPKRGCRVDTIPDDANAPQSVPERFEPLL